jgi:hypothetical protein
MSNDERVFHYRMQAGSVDIPCLSAGTGRLGGTGYQPVPSGY